jgi:hypothetical protein
VVAQGSHLLDDHLHTARSVAHDPCLASRDIVGTSERGLALSDPCRAPCRDSILEVHGHALTGRTVAGFLAVMIAVLGPLKISPTLELAATPAALFRVCFYLFLLLSCLLRSEAAAYTARRAVVTLSPYTMYGNEESAGRGVSCDDLLTSTLPSPSVARRTFTKCAMHLSTVVFLLPCTFRRRWPGQGDVVFLLPCTFAVSGRDRGSIVFLLHCTFRCKGGRDRDVEWEIEKKC